MQLESLLVFKINTCNQYMTQPPHIDLTTNLLEKMTKLSSPLERQIFTLYSNTTFQNTQQDIINPSNILHHEL